MRISFFCHALLKTPVIFERKFWIFGERGIFESFYKDYGSVSYKIHKYNILIIIGSFKYIYKYFF